MKYLRTIIGSIVLAIALYYFFSILIEQKHIFLDIQKHVLITSVYPIFLFTLAVVVSGLLWGKLASSLLDKNIDEIEAIKVHLLSWILKYLPGQAGALLNKLNWAVNKNHDKIAVSSSFIYEHFFLLTSSVILSIPLFLIFNSILYDSLFYISIIFVVLTWFFFQKTSRSNLFIRVNYVLKKISNKKLDEKYFLIKKDLIRFNVYYLIPRLLNGIGFALILVFITPLTPFSFILSISVYILAGVVGLAAIFVPSGIGVREAVIVFFGSMYLDQDIAVLVSVLSRVYSLISDMIIFIIYLILQVCISK